jgi:hypothetical protein
MANERSPAIEETVSAGEAEVPRPEEAIMGSSSETSLVMDRVTAPMPKARRAKL